MNTEMQEAFEGQGEGLVTFVQSLLTMQNLPDGAQFRYQIYNQDCSLLRTLEDWPTITDAIQGVMAACTGEDLRIMFTGEEGQRPNRHNNLFINPWSNAKRFDLNNFTLSKDILRQFLPLVFRTRTLVDAGISYENKVFLVSVNVSEANWRNAPGDQSEYGDDVKIVVTLILLDVPKDNENGHTVFSSKSGGSALSWLTGPGSTDVGA